MKIQINTLVKAPLQDNSWAETTGNNVFNFDTTWFPFPPLGQSLNLCHSLKPADRNR